MHFFTAHSYGIIIAFPVNLRHNYIDVPQYFDIMHIFHRVGRIDFLSADVSSFLLLRRPDRLPVGRRFFLFLPTSADSTSRRPTFRHFSPYVGRLVFPTADVSSFFFLRRPARLPGGRRFVLFLPTSAGSTSCRPTFRPFFSYVGQLPFLTAEIISTANQD